MGKRSFVVGLCAAFATLSPATATSQDLGSTARSIDTNLVRSAAPVSRNVTCAEIGTISCGQTIAGNINSAEDCALQLGNPPMPDGTYFDRYFLSALAGQTLTIDLLSDDFDAFLLLADDGGSVFDADNDGGTGTNAQLVFEAPADADYLVVPNNAVAGVEGDYILSVTCEGGPEPPTAAPVAPTEGVFRIDAGGASTCLLNGDAAMACFGNGRFGQLGIGNRESTLSARFVRTSDVIRELGINDIASGGAHSCYLTNEFAVYCWGDNSNGQLGLPTSTRELLEPPELPVLLEVQSLSAGALHTCASTLAGEVFCWGHNHEGQLGDGSTQDSHVPVKVQGLDGIQDVFVGGFHSCAIDGAGDVHCWGSNDFGQVSGEVSGDAPSPTPVPDLGAAATEVSAGFTHSCALLAGGNVECWGGVELLAPKSISGFSNIVELTSGGFHTCGLTGAGAVLCAGLNDFDQLGTGDFMPSMDAVPVPGLASGVRTLDAGGSHTCAVTAADQLVCWGDDRQRQLGTYDADFLLEVRRKQLLGARRNRS